MAVAPEGNLDNHWLEYTASDAGTKSRLSPDRDRKQARRLAAACAHEFPAAERDELNERLGAVEQAVAATAA